MLAMNTTDATSTRHVISVLIADRTGILRDITGAVTAMGGNIDGIRQSVVAGYFTVILTASFPTPITASEVYSRMSRAFTPGEAWITAIPYEDGRIRAPVGGERYAVILTGQDHPGILKDVTALLAGHGINIEDWHVEFDGTRVTHVGQITVPRALDIQQLQTEFRHLASTHTLQAGIQHENIFRAISEIGPIKPLVTHS